MYQRTSFEEIRARKQIKGRVLSTLEFDKILGKLNDKAHTIYGHELCMELCPIADFDEVDGMLRDVYHKTLHELNTVHY